MLKAYKVENNCLVKILRSTELNWLDGAVWIDLVNPTDEEIAAVESFSRLSLPNIEETAELEASSRYAVFEQGFQLNCMFPQKVEGTFSNLNVAFLSNDSCLISLCTHQVSTIRLLKKQWKKAAMAKIDPQSIIISLLERKIDRLADLSENAYLAIDKISRKIFSKGSSDAEETIDDLSGQDDLNGKIRLCLMDGQRDLNFLLRRELLDKDNLICVNEMLEDIKTLLTHNTFLSERIDFILTAALGFINIEQNKIIKIFSIVAVVLMPPTVIASIYGMNFEVMPELSWPWGYPMSIGLMFIAGLSPYLYFKRKGWL